MQRNGLSTLAVFAAVWLAGCASSPKAKDWESVTLPRAEVKTPAPKDPGASAKSAVHRPPGPGPGGAKSTRQCEAQSSGVEAAFAALYRRQHCPLCSDRAALAPLAVPGRSAPADVLERTAAGLRGRRQRLVLYYFMIPCEPCDALLPYVRRAMARYARTDMEILPVMDALDEQLVDPQVQSALAQKFPTSLPHLTGLYRDRAPFGEGFRKIARGTPATVVFSGPNLSEIKVLYGEAQTRFWKRAAGAVAKKERRSHASATAGPEGARLARRR